MRLIVIRLRIEVEAHDRQLGALTLGFVSGVSGGRGRRDVICARPGDDRSDMTGIRAGLDSIKGGTERDGLTGEAQQWVEALPGMAGVCGGLGCDPSADAGGSRVVQSGNQTRDTLTVRADRSSRYLGGKVRTPAPDLHSSQEWSRSAGVLKARASAHPRLPRRIQFRGRRGCPWLPNRRG